MINSIIIVSIMLELLNDSNDYDHNNDNRNNINEDNNDHDKKNNHIFWLEGIFLKVLELYYHLHTSKDWVISYMHDFFFI